ncbi:hypothetical protein ES703_62124 [subsurface metagenome]
MVGIGDDPLLGGADSKFDGLRITPFIIVLVLVDGAICRLSFNEPEFIIIDPPDDGIVAIGSGGSALQCAYPLTAGHLSQAVCSHRSIGISYAHLGVTDISDAGNALTLCAEPAHSAVLIIIAPGGQEVTCLVLLLRKVVHVIGIGIGVIKPRAIRIGDRDEVLVCVIGIANPYPIRDCRSNRAFNVVQQPIAIVVESEHADGCHIGDRIQPTLCIIGKLKAVSLFILYPYELP